jgi:hypothetical protein
MKHDTGLHLFRFITIPSALVALAFGFVSVHKISPEFMLIGIGFALASAISLAFRPPHETGPSVPRKERHQERQHREHAISAGSRR